MEKMVQPACGMQGAPQGLANDPITNLFALLDNSNLSCYGDAYPSCLECAVQTCGLAAKANVQMTPAAHDHLMPNF